MGKAGELWHLVEAKRADDAPTIFRIRELDPRLDQPCIFVIELPYPVADSSKLPDAPAYRRFATFEEQWLDPTCLVLGWTTVGVKIEDGSFFVYLYGAGDPKQLIERLSPFDGQLAFFDEQDPKWDEYAALRELLEEAKTIPAKNKPAKKKPAKKKPAKKKPAPRKKTTKKKPVAKKTPAKKKRKR
jgi:hypothetical protein